MTLHNGPYSEYFGTDHAWPVLDVKGFVGVFITAGWGPIPRIVQAYPLMLEVESRVTSLPPGKLAWLHSAAARDPSTIGLARQGFYVYDWPAPSTTGPYRRMATPALAIHVRDLPPGVAECLPSGLELPVSFAEAEEIDVRAYLDCLHARE